MSRRSVPVQPASRDGTSQRSRRLAALDPAYAPIDERTSADVLRFVQAYADQLNYIGVDPDTGDVRALAAWSDFVRRPDISVADMVAYAANPSRFAGDRARWLGRPHFALLLAFVQQLGHARDQLNGFTRRHLDYYYRDLLGIRAEPPTPDRATVLFGLAPSAREARIAAGTALLAGRDPGGVPRTYVTERELVVNRAVVAEQRSVFVDRRITGIPDVRLDRSLTAAGAFAATLRMALGQPVPAQPVPPWRGMAIDTAFFVGLRAPLNFASAKGALHLDQFELRALVQMWHRRRDADPEWAQLNALLGLTGAIANPRDFNGNLARRIAPVVLDFTTDGLPQVATVDDLYTYRTDADVRAYIDKKLAVIGYDNFIAAMQIKLRIDADWAEINRLLERLGRRQRGVLQWSLAPADPTNFPANLQKALGTSWPPAWPWTTGSIDGYEAAVRDLEVHLAMPVERILVLVAFAEKLGGDAKSEDFDWSDVDRILADAYAELLRAARQAKLAQVRAAPTVAGFDAEANFALGTTQPIGWADAAADLASHLDRAQVELLSRFRAGIAAGQPIYGFSWGDADRLFELAWRDVQQLPVPVAQHVEVHNAYAFADATLVKPSATAPGWKTFGARPAAADDRHPLGAALGIALRTPLLSLSEGKRTIIVTFGLRKDGFGAAEQALFLQQIGVSVAPAVSLATALGAALTFEVTTAKGWIPLAITGATLFPGTPGHDYWSARGLPRAIVEDRPALQIAFQVDPTRDALAPLKGSPDAWPTLRATLKPRWNKDAAEWRTSMEAFAPLVIVATALQVTADGLAAIHLQADDRTLDPKKPFEPFGSQPAVGTRFYLEHPELTRARLDALRFDLTWMGLPGEALKTYYTNYPGLAGDTTVFKVHVALLDDNKELALGDLSLFHDITPAPAPATPATATTSALWISDVPGAIQASAPGYVYTSRADLESPRDVRDGRRYLQWELTPVDFGHGVNASLAAKMARNLAVAIAAKTVTTDAGADAYRVEPPYTPKLKSLRVMYATSVEIVPSAMDADNQLLHVHPFGVAPIDPAAPGVLPTYTAGGELYIGVRDLAPPQHLALLLQLAEGTSDPDLEPMPVSWSYLDGDRFVALPGAAVVSDTTRGLINSGIVELALPPAATGGRLPPDQYWLRVAIARNPTSVCDVVAVRAQAVSVVFADHGNVPAHYDEPLPVGTIDRLADPDATIATVDQPYSSYGGRSAEQPATFDTRVSERLRHKNRALSAWDYERLVLHAFRQIFKAKCLASADGVDVVVIPDVRQLYPADQFAPKAPANLLLDIQTYLAARAPATADIRVRNAQYVSVQVRLGVRFRAGVDEDFAARRLDEELVRFLSPWAFDDGAELTIGGRIYANSIIDFVDRRDYVDYVTDIELFSSTDGVNYDLVPPTAADYHVATRRPDQVLVTAQHHYFDVIPDSGYQQTSFIGINFARIELDFIVGRDL